MGIRISQVPKEHKEKVIRNMLLQRGPVATVELVEEDILLAAAFAWAMSSEGQKFWNDIDEVEEKKTSKNELNEFIKEAEKRGFAVGVKTIHGEIINCYDHELTSSGDFFYHNIRVFKNGKWLEPIVSSTSNNNNSNPELLAIHALFSELMSSIRRN